MVAIGAAVILHSLAGVAFVPRPYEWMLFAALAIATGSFSVKIASVVATISISDTFFITLAVLFGAAPAAIAVAVDSLIMSWRLGHAWRRIMLNMAAPAVSIWAGAQIFFLIARVPALAHSDVAVGSLIGPLLLMTLIYFALNSGLIATAVGLESGQSPLDIWRRHFQWLGIGYMASASLAFCFVLLIQQVSFLAAIVILPMLAVFHLTLKASYGRLEDARRHLADVDRLYLSTVETLAMAIDAKDDVTHSHVRRVQAYAVGMARALGFTDESTLKAIEAAALLHDTGKLAVPEHILNKPGKLTPSEFEKMKLHVDVGADILSLVDFPYPVVPIVRHHHEHWNGGGYPAGLKGEEIPLGARILSVVDCFDALTSDRPYRKRMTDADALKILVDRRGTMYDPTIVDVFVAAYQQIMPPAATTPHPVAQAVGEARSHDREQERTEAQAAAAHAIPDGLLAITSLSRALGGEARLSDVGSLLWLLSRHIVECQAMAIFMADPAGDQVVARFAAGAAAGTLRGTSRPLGSGIAGWVATTRKPAVNADPELDLGPVLASSARRLKSCLALPLIDSDVVVAVLAFYAETPDAFSDDHLRLLDLLAPRLARSLAGAAAEEEQSPADTPDMSRSATVMFRNGPTRSSHYH